MSPKRRGIDELHELVSTSEVGLVIFTENYRRDTKALLELAVIIIEDKPMYLLVKRGTILPEKLRYIAVDLEFYDGRSDFDGAATRLVSRMKERMQHEPQT